MNISHTQTPLRPRESETREIKDLSGLWNFCTDPNACGQNEGWPAKGLPSSQLMPVPSSINDLTQDQALKDYLGWIWYERDDFVPAQWQGQDIRLWIGAAAHVAKVWVNGQLIAEHEGGFLPFSGDVNDCLNYGGSNRIVIAIDTRLSWRVLPPGQVAGRGDRTDLPEDWQVNDFHFDFVNYVGLHRPVKWLVQPPKGVTSFAVTPGLRDDSVGTLDYAYAHGGASATIRVRDLNQTILAETTKDGSTAEGALEVPNITPWAPLAPQLYSVEIEVYDEAQAIIDVYRLRSGFRSIRIEGEQFFINNKPFYFKGFGRHEDASLRGRGLDLVHQIKDVNLMGWIGANSFRTSHYPYAEEAMDLADELGFVVIDEVPAVGLGIWAKWGQQDVIFNDNMAGPVLLKHHCQVVHDLVNRDRHHPCVVSWSPGNESATWETAARPYYQSVVDTCKAADSTRPTMLVLNVGAKENKVGDLFDWLGLNSYRSWYDQTGQLDSIRHSLPHDLEAFWEEYAKPIMITEYGTDTIAGFHQDPPAMFTEEYQVAFFKEYHAIMDRYPWLVGEHVWNFADFMTKQGLTRIDGNKKGVFTRDRRPKMGAHELRQRWKNSHPKW